MYDLTDTNTGMYLGALPSADGSTFFRVWAPFAETVSVEVGPPHRTRRVALVRAGGDYFEGLAENAGHNDLYRYVVDSNYVLPDPASRSQPEGVHGPSRVVDHSRFHWSDEEWRGIPLGEYIIYELHVGTFTGEGTFEAITDRIEYLKELGVNAIELMPVAQFPGGRNWGYDGTFPFAPHSTYGGPGGLKAFVDACHGHGISVILDVVYNHLGPEGNYLGRFGPYFTDRYRTPWGNAINFDGPMSDEVRRYFIENALEWITRYHIDALRIDAIHGIFDFSARTFLEDLAIAVGTWNSKGGRSAYLIAESDLNDIRVITPHRNGGIGIDAQWNDDFHHALHTLLTGESDGYYQDFGTIEDMAKAYREGYVYTGQFSPYRLRKHGNPSKQRPASQFVVFCQNHDQVGNRADGRRLGDLVDHDKLRMAALAVMLAPCVPLLFMGEEYGETAPFFYFVSHGDKDLIEAVRAGRAEEFASFDGSTDIPDPQSEETFLRSKINPRLHLLEPHSSLFAFYRHLSALRRSIRPWEMRRKRPPVNAWHDRATLLVRMPLASGEVACFFNFSGNPVTVSPRLATGSWTMVADSLSPQWGGSGEKAPSLINEDAASDTHFTLGPFNAVVYRKEP